MKLPHSVIKPPTLQKTKNGIEAPPPQISTVLFINYTGYDT